MIIVYAIIRDYSGQPPPSVRLLSVGAIQAAVGEVDEEPRASAEAAVAFDAIVGRIAEAAGAILPARFATCFADEAAVVKAISERREALDSALSLVAGRVQMTLRLSGTPGEYSPPVESAENIGPGAKYLKDKFRRHLRERTVQELDVVRPDLERFVVAERAERNQNRPWFASVYQLIAREAVEEYSAAVRRVLPVLEARGITVAISGPRPPYAFAPEEGGS